MHRDDDDDDMPMMIRAPCNNRMPAMPMLAYALLCIPLVYDAGIAMPECPYY